MLRLVLLISLTCFVALATSAEPAFEEQRCSQPCPDDGPDASCPPSCVDCLGCVHHVSFAPAGAVVFLTSLAWIPIASPLHAPQAIDPREVLHVPRQLGA